MPPWKRTHLLRDVPWPRPVAPRSALEGAQAPFLLRVRVQYLPGFAAVCEQCYGGSNIDPGRGIAETIICDGEMPSSLILDCSRWLKSNDWRVNPDEETTNWRARRGKTAHRVRSVDGLRKARKSGLCTRFLLNGQMCLWRGWLDFLAFYAPDPLGMGPPQRAPTAVRVWGSAPGRNRAQWRPDLRAFTSLLTRREGMAKAVPYPYPTVWTFRPINTPKSRVNYGHSSTACFHKKIKDLD